MTTGKPVVAALQEWFRCKYGARLTRAACARMSQTASRTGKVRPGQEAVSLATRNPDKCRGCDVGKAHRDGKVPASAPAVPAPIPATSLLKLLPRYCLVCGEPMPRKPRLGKRVTCSQACSTEYKQHGTGAVIEGDHDTSGYDLRITAPKVLRPGDGRWG